MNILSLFDGMACGRIALERAGIEVTNYYASEIDKYAMQIAKKNYPDIIHVGDITKLHAKDLPRIDMIIGGSPCQGFSFAGKQLNFEDPRSKLFFEFVRLVKECRPGFFLLENVKMKKEYQNVISEKLGVEPVEINSSLVSAQMRKRLYWANFPITQPEDRGLVLQDILEDAITEKEKSYCIDAHYEGGTVKNYLEDCKRQLVYQINQSKESGAKQPYQQNRVYFPGGKHPAICTEARGGVPTNSADITGRYLDPYGNALPFRKLTPIECERLQTVPDNYTEGGKQLATVQDAR